MWVSMSSNPAESETRIDRRQPSSDGEPRDRRLSESRKGDGSVEQYAWEHFRRTGCILPGYAHVVATRLGERG
jgi:hypothetical protein